jgi:hypothetical protein
LAQNVFPSSILIANIKTSRSGGEN